MKVKIKVNESLCSISNISDNTQLHEVDLRDDLKKALDLLKKINKLKTVDNDPIYKARMVGGVSAWSFHQNTIFWEYLRHFVYFEELVKILVDKKYTVVIDDTTDTRILSILSLGQIPTEIEGEGKHLNIAKHTKRVCVDALCRVLARTLGCLALLSARVSNKKTLVYSPDKYDARFGSDFRLQEIYMFLINKKIRFVEIFHTTLGKVFLKNALARKRTALYREYLPFVLKHSTLIDKKFSPIVIGFEPHQEKYISNLLVDIDKVAKLSILWVLTLVRYIRFMKIKVLITVDDMRSAQEIITACKILKIKTYGFQHGHINLYHTGLMNHGIPPELAAPFDRLYVWNPYWLKKLTANSSMYTTANVSVGGYLRPPKNLEGSRPSRKIPNSFKDLSILVASDTWAPKNEVRYYINKLLDYGCNIYLGIRPDLPVDKQVANYGLSSHPNLHTSATVDREEINKMDCIIGVYSTFLYEMMNYDLPVLAMDTSFCFGEDLIIDNLAYKLKKNFTFEEIKDYLTTFKSKKDIMWPEQKETVQGTLSSIYENYSK